MTNATFPLYPHKHTLAAVPDPSEHAVCLRTRVPAATLASTAGVIMLYQRSLFREVQAGALDGWVRGDLRLLEHRGRTIGICGGFGLGAPAAALVLEQLISLGTTRVITLGTAASLQPDLQSGDVVACRLALRDEGVSHHYLAPARSVRPSARLTDHLVHTLQSHHVAVRQGPGWSTDAPYRETHAEVTRYSTEGILAADMEAAGIFAVAQHRRIDAAALFVIADSLLHRQPREDSPDTQTALRTVLRAALTALSTAP
ncbi:nucleoside phosphorylase [Streptomyces orinoci]|uniref:Uridine phosphorylase n=1 Tax=Streptomyces orinoci TaxID=67339 RepID=A0ABV3JUW6_STRON|nr:nucleoside phosphorylase [Streptomyces orinoci]